VVRAGVFTRLEVRLWPLADDPPTRMNVRYWPKADIS